MKPIPELAASITKFASKQTYYMIRFLTNRERVDDAYRAYAYFRWVDDRLDAGTPFGDDTGSQSERNAFLARQQMLLENCYRGKPDRDACPEERMLVELVQHDPDPHSGLYSYLHNMMAVMAFDADRRDRTVMQAKLSEYSRKLATAVTEALYYFIGHDDPSPRHEALDVIRIYSVAPNSHKCQQTVMDAINLTNLGVSLSLRIPQ